MPPLDLPDMLPTSPQAPQPLRPADRPHTLPSVSIITPAYNAARFLDATIRSVAEQSFSDWEMIVVDDCSPDETPAIAERWAKRDPRVRLIRMSKNAGPGAARNEALAEAQGRYVAFLDGDDLWRPQKLEVQISFMKETGATFSFTGYSIIDEQGRPVGRCVRAPERVDYRALLRNTIIGCLTVVLDRAQLEPLRMPMLRQHEDLTLWYDILKRGIVARGISQDLALYRIRRGSASRNKLRSALHMWKVYREVEGLSVPEALECFTSYAWRACLKNRL